MTAVASPPLDGGNVLVTGASAGIGRELAARLAARARTLVLLARRTTLLEQLRDRLLARNPGLEVLVMRVGLSDEGEVDRVAGEVRDRVGFVDVLVNNAGVGDQALFDRSDWQRTRQVLLTNVFAVAQLRISAAQCAKEALAGFERGAPLVFPGRAYRIAMMAPVLPRGLQRRRAARAASRVRGARAEAG